MLLGIDDFKNINIKRGRGYGNYILKIVTEIMEEVVDLSLSIYRVDGDRYAINMEGRTKGMVQTTYLLIQEKVLPYCTMSAGAVPYGEEILDGSGVLYQYAENALDRAKKRGKNNLVFFSADDYEKNLKRIDLQEELRESVRNGFAGFHLCYQLQVSGTDYHVRGAEALLRYESPSRGRISPEEFIPLLEQTELIDPVGDWVLATALHQCKCWRKWVPDFHISVNISYIQLRNEMITQKVLDALKKAELSGESLTLEVTESMQLQEYQYFNIDSALVYVNANIVIAQQTGDDNMMNLCRIQRSYIYAIIGQLHESVEEMRQIDHDKLTGGMLIEYLGQMSLLYSRFAEYTDGGSDKRDYYYEREHFYIDSTLKCTTS